MQGFSGSAWAIFLNDIKQCRRTELEAEGWILRLNETPGFSLSIQAGIFIDRRSRNARVGNAATMAATQKITLTAAPVVRCPSWPPATRGCQEDSALSSSSVRISNPKIWTHPSDLLPLQTSWHTGLPLPSQSSFSSLSNFPFSTCFHLLP